MTIRFKPRLPNPASLSPDGRKQYRDSLVGIFKGNGAEILPDGSAIYTCDDEEGGRFYLHMFAGKALRTIDGSGWYRSPDPRADAIERFKQDRAEYHTAKMLRRQSAKRPHTLKVGDVLNTHWGYEQTNVEFYEVVAVSGVMVTLCQIAASTTETGFMCGETIPFPGELMGEPIRRRASVSNWVRINSGVSASPWNGKPQYVSWYG